MVVRVRDARVDDLDRIIDCQISVFESFRSILPDSFIDGELEMLKSSEWRERFKKSLENPDTIALVAEEGGYILGVAYGNVRGGVSHLGFIGVKLEFRRRGVGSSLLEEYISRSKSRGAHKVSLWTVADLKDAVRLYVKKGFVPEGFMRKHNHKMDMIFYSYFLQQP
jgi:ribosomal protein S18 acetylase RimI-like enzyme